MPILVLVALSPFPVNFIYTDDLWSFQTSPLDFKLFHGRHCQKEPPRVIDLPYANFDLCE